MIINNGVLFNEHTTYAELLEVFRNLRISLTDKSHDIWNEYIISECVVNHDFEKYNGNESSITINSALKLYESNLRNSFLENKPSELDLGANVYIAKHGDSIYGLLECSNIDIRLSVIKNLDISEFIVNPESVKSGEITQDEYDTRFGIWSSILDGKYPNDRMFKFELSYTGPRELNKKTMIKQLPSDDIRAEFLCAKLHQEIIPDEVIKLKKNLHSVNVEQFIDEE